MATNTFSIHITTPPEMSTYLRVRFDARRFHASGLMRDVWTRSNQNLLLRNAHVSHTQNPKRLK